MVIQLSLSLSLSRFPRAQRGFTLVELSIVLVVIGLLIGGILIGQSLISSAKLQAQIRQFSQFDILTNNFKTQFGCLPGEMSQFHHNSPAEEAGDVVVYIKCDNNLTSWAYGSINYGFYTMEPLFFFSDLSKSGLLKDDYVFSRTFLHPGPGGQFPIPALFGSSPLRTSFFGLNYESALSVMGNSQGNVFWIIDMINIGGPANSFVGSLGNLPLRATEAAALDAKMDDGLPRTGNIRITSGGSWAASHLPADSGFWPFPVQDTDTFCSIGNAYNLSGPYFGGWGQWHASDPLCSLIVKANVY